MRMRNFLGHCVAFLTIVLGVANYVVARDLFPLAERLDNEPWMGARPCTPDMMPIIGRAPVRPLAQPPASPTMSVLPCHRPVA